MVTPPNLGQTASHLNTDDVFGRLTASIPSSDAEPITEIVAPGLKLVAMIKTHPGMRMLTVSDLSDIGLDRRALLALAKANALAGARPIAEVTPVPPFGQLGRIAGDQEEAARLASVQDWQKLAVAFDNDLLVAAPAVNVMLYINGNAPNAADALQKAARGVMATASHPVSDTVLRWSMQGWEIVMPPRAAPPE